MAVPAAFAVFELTAVIWSLLANGPVLLAAASPRVRSDLYSSLAESSGALLGFTITAVAILVSLPPRTNASAPREVNLAQVRIKLVGVLLAHFSRDHACALNDRDWSRPAAVKS
ncbi:MAG: hypothetical protein ACRDLL_09375 [Solirubrobacterales bacterium]